MSITPDDHATTATVLSLTSGVRALRRDGVEEDSATWIMDNVERTARRRLREGNWSLTVKGRAPVSRLRLDVPVSKGPAGSLTHEERGAQSASWAEMSHLRSSRSWTPPGEASTSLVTAYTRILDTFDPSAGLRRFGARLARDAYVSLHRDESRRAWMTRLPIDAIIEPASLDKDALEEDPQGRAGALREAALSEATRIGTEAPEPLRSIVRLRIEHHSEDWPVTAEALNAEGSRNARGARWTGNAVKQVVSRAARAPGQQTLKILQTTERRDAATQGRDEAVAHHRQARQRLEQEARDAAAEYKEKLRHSNPQRYALLWASLTTRESGESALRASDVLRRQVTRREVQEAVRQTRDELDRAQWRALAIVHLPRPTRPAPRGS